MSFKLGLLSCNVFISQSLRGKKISKGPIKCGICIKSIWCKSAACCRLCICACTRRHSTVLYVCVFLFKANPAYAQASICNCLHMHAGMCKTCVSVIYSSTWGLRAGLSLFIWMIRRWQYVADDQVYNQLPSQIILTLIKDLQSPYHLPAQPNKIGRRSD